MLGSLAAGAVLVAGMATSIALAQSSDPHQQGMHRHGWMDWDAIDANHDGKISAAEHAAHARAMFDRIDLNHDGMISRDEIHAHVEAMRNEHRAKLFDRIDTNHDGMISKDELEAAMHDRHGMRRMRGDHMMGRDGMMGDDAMGGDGMPPPAR